MTFYIGCVPSTHTSTHSFIPIPIPVPIHDNDDDDWQQLQLINNPLEIFDAVSMDNQRIRRTKELMLKLKSATGTMNNNKTGVLLYG
ncbi:hypothetical protein ACLKA6_006500 [Drosophila palustris]